ncbi:hypothetical protein D3Y55_11195 [Mesorhizobium sp. DCY119]|nr:hypothetical protein D3Y55_11195 [Mesorhizobium sp. DCY119]
MLQLRQFCTAAAFIDVPAWIPDTLRSFLAHEVENDELRLGLPLIFGLGELPARQLRIAADFGRFAGEATSKHSPSPTSAACRWATSKLVILDLVSEERAESVGNPCRNAEELRRY